MKRAPIIYEQIPEEADYISHNNFCVDRFWEAI